LTTLAFAAFPATCTYKYQAADESERRCGITNLFRWDYSAQLTDGVSFSADESDVRVDFTRLKNWKQVCLVSMYEEVINGPVEENPWEGLSYREIGRWQCGPGSLHGALTMALIKADGATLVRQLKFPESIRPRITITSYERGPGWERYPAAGYRQCSDIEKAVARCARTLSGEVMGCHLLFHPDKRTE
jgi:hypothetical protein